MSRTRVAIACQGGGSQCAFVAGALETLLANGIQHRYQIVGLSSALIGRPEFTDLRAVVAKHIDLDELPGLLDDDSPVLLLGAGDVLEGTFKVFSSMLGEISVDSLLASAAIPNLFPAVWVDGHAYWDGIFSANPPVAGFLRAQLMGEGRFPQEIWILQVNPVQCDQVPELPGEITARRNHLAGNLSLRHELRLIEIANMLLHEGALTDQFRARFQMDETEAITVRFIRMSDELQRSLDYPSKLCRQPSHIARLMADGAARARDFLAELPTAEPRYQGFVADASQETH
jgi:NTE family protein